MLLLCEELTRNMAHECREEWDERRARRRARRGLASVTRLAQVRGVQVEQSSDTAPGPEAA